MAMVIELRLFLLLPKQFIKRRLKQVKSKGITWMLPIRHEMKMSLAHHCKADKRLHRLGIFSTPLVGSTFQVIFHNVWVKIYVSWKYEEVNSCTNVWRKMSPLQCGENQPTWSKVNTRKQDNEHLFFFMNILITANPPQIYT